MKADDLDFALALLTPEAVRSGVMRFLNWQKHQNSIILCSHGIYE